MTWAEDVARPNLSGHSDDLRLIERMVGLPFGTVLAVERRQNSDYAIRFRNPRPDSLAARQMPRALVSRRVIRIPRRVVHARYRRRGGWKVRHRNLQLFLWANRTLPRSPAAENVRLERGDRMLDELRVAVIRASHVGEAVRGSREQLERRHRRAAS